MAVESSGTLTGVAPGTPTTVANPTSAAKRIFCVDVSNLSGTERVELQIKEPLLSGDTATLVKKAVYYAGESEPHTKSLPFSMPFGGDFIITQVGGSSRNFKWRVETV
jgi:hypothetical protein